MALFFRIHGLSLLGIAILRLVASLLVFVSPMVLDRVIVFLDPASQEANWRGFLYAIVILVASMLESLFNNQHEYYLNLVTLRMKAALKVAVYRKSCRLSNEARQHFSTGEIVNLISVDAQRIVDLVNNLNTLWSAPLQIAVGVYLLWNQLSYASLAGFSYMLFIIPLNMMITGRIQSIQVRLMQIKDLRAKLMDEILNGIKVIKLNAFEAYFERRANHHRSLEMKQLQRFAYANSMMSFFFSSSSFFVSLISFLTFTLISNKNVLTASRAFVSLALFNIIRIPLSFLPLLFSYAGIAIVSIRRINEFLNSSEIDHEAVTWKLNSTQNMVIRIRDGTFAWSNKTPVLSKVNLSISHGQLVGVIGAVGSGKSTLLSAMLGEMQSLAGSVEICGRIGYVPQEAWIRNATIRENILMNRSYEANRYQAVLEYCALHLDLAMFAAGDMTEVGEKGINLSGGQKQRISLARAVYANADLYILDNPLSALDIHVGKHIFNQVIGPKGCLRYKTRVLVTHMVSLLTKVDQVVFISNGQIQEIGTFYELIANNGPFAEYVAEYIIDNQQKPSPQIDLNEIDFIQEMSLKIQSVIEKVETLRSGSLVRSKPLERSTNPSGSMSRSSVRSSALSQSVHFLDRGRLTHAEEIAEGAVKSSDQKAYFRSIGYCVCLVTALALFFSNFFQVLSSLWLSDWANDSVQSNGTISKSHKTMRLAVYGSLGLIEILFTFFSTLSINLNCVRAARVLHGKMLSHIMRAPMNYFDTTPMGRILNRFTRDIDVVDLQISTSIRMLSMQVLRTLVSFLLISLEAPIILVLLLPLSLLYYVIQRLYLNTSRQLKRIEAVTRSPLNNFLSESVNGASSIRAYRLARSFMSDMEKRIDAHHQSYWLNIAAARWLGVRLEAISYSIVFAATLLAVLERDSLSPGLAGLAISYSLNITSILNLFIRSYTDFETNFVSIERCVEYTQIPVEVSESTTIVAPGWPASGVIVFENYSTQYREDLPLSLKRINLTIPGGAKVAIVGRTGSGKSSLTLALFRILEPSEGTITIDGIDIRHVSLGTLRQRLTIVPQDPVIFSGSLRDNVDVLHQCHDDNRIREALRDANLGNFLNSIEGNLDYQLSSAENLSTGQKQLICLARALLKSSSVVVFDEATASVDHETESHIHGAIFSARFASRTVLVIAHRIDRILDYDYVLVMNHGEAVEFDTPRRLAAQTDSMFHALASEANLI